MAGAVVSVRHLKAMAARFVFSVAFFVGGVAGQNAVALVDENGGLIKQFYQVFGVYFNHGLGCVK